MAQQQANLLARQGQLELREAALGSRWQALHPPPGPPSPQQPQLGPLSASDPAEASLRAAELTLARESLAQREGAAAQREGNVAERERENGARDSELMVREVAAARREAVLAAREIEIDSRAAAAGISLVTLAPPLSMTLAPLGGALPTPTPTLTPTPNPNPNSYQVRWAVVPCRRRPVPRHSGRLA